MSEEPVVWALDLGKGSIGEAVLQVALCTTATQRAVLQLEAHSRVREALRAKAKVWIEPALPMDILRAYLLLPIL
jgi:hypothetical protein